MPVSHDDHSSSLTRVQDLVRNLPACNPDNATEVHGLRTDLEALRRELRIDGARVEDGLCAFAGRMLEVIEQHGKIDGRETLALVREILGSVSEALSAYAPTQTPRRNEEITLQASAPADEDSSLGLSLMDQRKLGEILVSLSMLTPDELDEALKRQRALGKRFGETLVELGLLSKSSIECALRMQKRHRGTTSLDPWMQKN